MHLLECILTPMDLPKPLHVPSTEADPMLITWSSDAKIQ